MTSYNYLKLPGTGETTDIRVGAGLLPAQWDNYESALMIDNRGSWHLGLLGGIIQDRCKKSWNCGALKVGVRVIPGTMPTDPLVHT